MLNTLIKYLAVCLLLLLINNRVQGQTSYTKLTEQSVADAIDSTSFISASLQFGLNYNPERDAKRLLINTGVNAGMSLVKFGVLWVSPEHFSNWDKDAIKEKGWC